MQKPEQVKMVSLKRWWFPFQFPIVIPKLIMNPEIGIFKHSFSLISMCSWVLVSSCSDFQRVGWVVVFQPVLVSKLQCQQHVHWQIPCTYGSCTVIEPVRVCEVWSWILFCLALRSLQMVRVWKGDQLIWEGGFLDSEMPGGELHGTGSDLP